MKSLPLALLLLAACASSSNPAGTELIDCSESGNEVTVMLAAADVDAPRLASNPDIQVRLGVEVSNNSQADIEVKSILIRPLDMAARFRVGAASGRFHEVIAEGKEHVFTLRTTGRYVRTFTEDVVVPEASKIEARVELASGQTYRCAFEVPFR